MGPTSSNFTRTSLYTWNDTDTLVDVFQIPESPVITTVPWLFLRNEHLSVQTSDVIYSFILTSKESDNLLAVFHCSSGSAGWFSPPLAPFGGIIPISACRKAQLVFLLSCVREWMNRHGGDRLVIKTAPSCYDQFAHELCHQSYLEAGFLPNHTYSNHYIPIGDQDFSQMIDPSERRRLAKGKKSGLEVRGKTGGCGPDIEGFLQHCYHAQGHQLPIQPGRLAKLMSLAPEHYLILTNWDGVRPIAVAIMVRISDRVLYHFMSGYLPESGAFSPALMLFEAAYNFCREKNIEIFDLGISIDHHGKYKPSLGRFKANIGGLECRKVFYEARL